MTDDIPAGHIASVHREGSRLSPSGEMLDFRWGLVSPCQAGHDRAIVFVCRRDFEDRWCATGITEDPQHIESVVLDGLVSQLGDAMCQDATLFGVPWANVTVKESAAVLITGHQMACSANLSARFRQMPLDQLEKIRRGIHELDVRRVFMLLDLVNDYLRYAWCTDGPQALG